MLRRALQVSAAALLAGTVAIWVMTGAHTGWTKTQLTEMKVDEVTGLDYPVVTDGFVMGVELLSLGVLMSVAEFGLSLLIKDRTKTKPLPT